MESNPHKIAAKLTFLSFSVLYHILKQKKTFHFISKMKSFCNRLYVNFKKILPVNILVLTILQSYLHELLL